MGAFEQALLKTGTADLLQSSGMRALITSPQIHRVAYAVDSGVATSLDIIPAEANKAYLIHGYYVNAGNTAVEGCTGITLSATEYFGGKSFGIDGFGLTANQVNQQSVRGTGLNILTQPGKPVTLEAATAAPNWRAGTVFYTVVDC